jgi:pyruvate kinase
MLESMTSSRRPTRAEATDVANAILDGTDCVMLSGESAMGKYPVEAVAMLAAIAEAIEPCRPSQAVRETLRANDPRAEVTLTDLIARSVETTLEQIAPAAVFVPTHSGATARRITRFRLPVWIVAVSSQETTCQRLQFSYGVFPAHEPEHPEDWNGYVREWLQAHEMKGELVVLTEGPSSKRPEANNRMEIIGLGGRPEVRSAPGA